LKKSLKTLSKTPKSSSEGENQVSTGGTIQTCFIRLKTYNRTLYLTDYKLRAVNEYVLYLTESFSEAVSFDSDDYIIPFCKSKFPDLELLPADDEIEPETLSLPSENVPTPQLDGLDWL